MQLHHAVVWLFMQHFVHRVAKNGATECSHVQNNGVNYRLMPLDPEHISAGYVLISVATW